MKVNQDDIRVLDKGTGDFTMISMRLEDYQALLNANKNLSEALEKGICSWDGPDPKIYPENYERCKSEHCLRCNALAENAKVLEEIK